MLREILGLFDMPSPTWNYRYDKVAIFFSKQGQKLLSGKLS